jgi:hypothetical protein
VKITNTGGVTLNSETTIAANLKVTKVKITGVATGVVINSDATSIVVPASAGIATTTETGSKIVAGSGTTLVTLTKASLGPGTYTAGTADLTLGASTTVEVASGGVVEIAEGATLKLTNDTSLLKVLAGGAVDVKTAGGDIIKVEGSQTGITFVAKKSSDSSASKWKITGTAPNFTVQIDSDGNTDAAILGKIQVTGSTSDAAIAGTTATAAAGKLTAGTDTIFIISASGS